MRDTGRKARHIFLDLDGTIIDPREGIVRSISHALTVLGRPVPRPESLEQFIGPPLAESFRTLLATTEDALIATAVGVYRERFAAIGILENRVYAGIPGALEALGKTSCLYVVTSKPAVYAETIVGRIGLRAHFVGIYGPELRDLRANKASLIRVAMSVEKLKPTTVTVVGDRKDDVEGARENGARSIGVTWGYGSREELGGADHVVASPAELVSLLGGE